MFNVSKLPVIDPPIKLIPIIKLTGRSTVLFIIRSTFLDILLFWIPIIKTENKVRLNTTVKINFFDKLNIWKNYLPWESYIL